MEELKIDIVRYAFKEYCREQWIFNNELNKCCHYFDAWTKFITIYERFWCKHFNTEEYTNNWRQVFNISGNDKVIECNIWFEYDYCIVLCKDNKEELEAEKKRRDNIRNADVL